jgi:archaellum biogenesis ATPase FlaH
MTPEEAGNFRTKYDDAITQFGLKDTDYTMLRESIESRFVQRQAWSICQKFVTELAEAQENQKTLVTRFQQFASEISIFGDAQSFVQVISLEDLIETKLKKELIERRDNPDRHVGIKCLYPEIDNDYNGFKRRRYMVITATEGGGKTTFMMNLAFNMAYGGSNVVYVTIEVTNEDVGYKLLSLHSGVNQNRIQKGGSGGDGLAPSIMSSLDAGMRSIVNTGIGKRFHLIQVLENTSRDMICRLIQRVRAFQKVDVVVIDYLQVVGREVNYGERIDQAIADVSNKFRAWGRQNNVLLITANQIKADKGRKLQEQVKDESDILITKGDTSGSKEISGAADYMFGVWTPRSRDKMIVFSTKNRHGKDTQQYTMSWDPNTGRVAEMGEFGEKKDEVAKVAQDREERNRIRNNFEAHDKASPMSIPGTTAGEEPPEEIRQPVPPWAGEVTNDDNFLNP